MTTKKLNKIDLLVMLSVVPFVYYLGVFKGLVAWALLNLFVGLVRNYRTYVMMISLVKEMRKKDER